MISNFAQWLMVATVLWPLLNALAFALPPLKKLAWRAAAFAALPGIALTFIAPLGTSVTLPQTALTILKLDPTGRIYLGFTSALWLFSGHYAIHCMRRESHRVRFEIFFLLSMAGNFMLILAHDIPTFYSGFALMGFASAGLVVHRGDTQAMRAGRIYLALAAVGEILLFVGFGFLAAGQSSLVIGEVVTAETSRLAIALLIVGFGIKAGALTVHFWLPLAHPTAPVPASAVLSGAMIKAGVLGWIRFLPLGMIPWPTLGLTLLVLGLLGALLGTIAGITQSNAKTVLAYSSLSQVGIMLVAIGVAFIDPTAWPTLLAALLVYAAHHGLAKGALFLGILPARHASSTTQVWFGRLGLLLPALALAGAPFTSGAIAKLALKEPIRYLPGFSAVLVGVLLPLAATGTTLLMIRFLTLAWPQRGREEHYDARGLWIPWMAAVTATVIGIWLLPGMIVDLEKVVSLEKVWASTWPVVAGIGLAIIWQNMSRRFDVQTPGGLPAGDIVVLVERILSPLRNSRRPPKLNDESPQPDRVRLDWPALMGRAESQLRLHTWLVLLGVLAALVYFLGK